MREELEAGRWGRTHADLVPSPTAVPASANPANLSGPWSPYQQAGLRRCSLWVERSKEGGREHSGERSSDFPASASLPFALDRESFLPLCHPPARPSRHRSAQGRGQCQGCGDGVGSGDMIAQGEMADRNGKSWDELGGGGVHLPCPPMGRALGGQGYGEAEATRAIFLAFPTCCCLEPRRGWPSASPEWKCPSKKGLIGTPVERTLGAVREE